MANPWQNPFPFCDHGLDGYAGRSSAGSFPAIGDGLYGTAGRDWEWTRDCYVGRHLPDATIRLIGTVHRGYGPPLARDTEVIIRNGRSL